MPSFESGHCAGNSNPLVPVKKCKKFKVTYFKFMDDFSNKLPKWELPYQQVWPCLILSNLPENKFSQVVSWTWSDHIFKNFHRCSSILKFTSPVISISELELPYCIGSPPNHYVDHASLAFSLLYVNLGQCPRLPPSFRLIVFKLLNKIVARLRLGMC